MERHPLPALLLMFILSVTTVCGNEYAETGSCTENQKAYSGSCYEFMTLPQSFGNAQAECELSGGHLAFIHNEETQQFLQKHLQPQHNWWIGLTSSFLNLSSPSSKDPLSWLDASEVSYSNRLDFHGTGCGYISNESDFHWVATENCSQEFYFICEFESGQTLACLDNHAVLKCDPGQAIEINESFYGRNKVHYCRVNYSLSNTSVHDRCNWVDVRSVISDVCDGHQVCEVPVETSAFGEPCPHLGSYLSIKYYCKDARNGARHSSQFKRSVSDNIINTCTCQDLHDSNKADINIKCLSNCDIVDVNMNISLQSDPTYLTEIEWFYVKPEQFSIHPKGSVVVSPCKKNKNGQMHLSHLGSGTFYNVSSVLLKTLSPGSTIVVKGYKNQDLGYGCYNIQLPTSRNLRLKRASITNIINLPSTTCTISPPTGDIFTLFKINCQSCSIQNCQIFLITSTGDYVNFGYQVTMNNLFLPQGSIQLSSTNLVDQEYRTTLPIQVTVSTNVSVAAVQNVVSTAVSLQKKGAISTDMLALVFKTISDNMNSNYSQNDKEMLVESMSTSLCNAMSQGNTVNLLNGIKVISSSVLSLVMHENELTPNAKEAVCCVLDKISNIQISLLNVMGNVTATSATLPVVLAASTLLNLSAANDQKTSESLLRIMNQVQGTMLAYKPINTEPIVLSSPLISLYVNRLSWDKLNQFQISTGSNSVTFSLPSSVSNLSRSYNVVNLRMMNIGMNPYAWNNDEIISGTIGGLFLTTDSGIAIPVTNLPDEIEILFPSVSATATNRTFLNLTTGNGTMPISVTARRTSLVVKLEPSDSTPLMLYLGFNYYPNDTRNVAKIQIPQTSIYQGDGYTWVITPYNMELAVGIYYLLVVPIVPAGGQSPASVLITALTTNCNYWNDNDKGWRDDGCRVGPLTTTLVTQCLCNHLTMFGTSFSAVHDPVGVSYTADVFPTFLNNLVVMGIFGAIFLGCILTVIWAYKKDFQDKTKIKWLKQQKSQYVRNKYNLLEMAIILLSLTALSAIISGTIQADKDLKYFQELRNLFPGFLDATSADTYLGYILAFLILLGTVKMCHMMRLVSKQKLISCMLYQEWNNTSSMVLIFSVVALFTVVLAYFTVTSEEGEIGDLIIMKICKMFGIPVKKK